MSIRQLAHFIFVIACVHIGFASNVYAANDRCEEEPFFYSQIVVQPLQSSMPSDCFCSEEKEQDCTRRNMHCCANWYPDSGCRIYCGTACIAPW